MVSIMILFTFWMMPKAQLTLNDSTQYISYDVTSQHLYHYIE